MNSWIYQVFTVFEITATNIQLTVYDAYTCFHLLGMLYYPINIYEHKR